MIEELPVVDDGRLPDICMWVPGRPQTAGSKSAIPGHDGRPRVIESGTAKSRQAKRTYRQDLRDAAERARAEHWQLDGPTARPLEVWFTFVMPRPSAMLRTGAHAGELKATAADVRPSTRPDAVKLARAAEDALTGVLWLDDAQIVDERLVKCWGDPARLEVTVRPL